MRISLIDKILSATALAIPAAILAITNIQISGISNTNTSPADLIRERAPIRLIQPEWVSSTPDTLSNWLAAETYARFALVLCLWLLSVILILRHHLRK